MLSSLIAVQYCYDYLVNQISLGLLLYAHLPTAIVAVFFGLFIFFKTKRLSSLILLGICISFSLWSVSNLFAWFAFLGSNVTMFFWSIIDIWSVAFFFLSYYFLFVFIKGKDLPVWQKILGLLIFLPNIFRTVTNANISTFDLNICEALENSSVSNYNVYFQVAFMCIIIAFIAKEFILSKNQIEKRKIALAGTGIVLFLFCFTAGIFAGIVIDLLDIATYPYNFEIYALFGMPILLVYLGFLIVKYHVFDLRVFMAQALAIAAVAIIGTQYAFLHETSSIVLNTINLILVLVVGVYLAKNVKREILLRKQVEHLAQNLKLANTQQAETTSFITHQIRGSFTDTLAGLEALRDGDFGKVSPEVKDVASKLFEIEKKARNELETFLKAQRVGNGTVQYDKKLFNLKNSVSQIIEQSQTRAEAKGLKYNVEIKDGEYMVNGDETYLSQVFANLIDNAIRYTPEGSIDIHLSNKKDEGGKNAVIFYVKDSGVGIKDEDKKVMFTKYGHGKDSRKVNTDSSGLGLFIAKGIVDAHGGKIWAESEGGGKGSSFYVELPIGRQ